MKVLLLLLVVTSSSHVFAQTIDCNAKGNDFNASIVFEVENKCDEQDCKLSPLFDTFNSSIVINDQGKEVRLGTKVGFLRLFTSNEGSVEGYVSTQGKDGLFTGEDGNQVELNKNINLLRLLFVIQMEDPFLNAVTLKLSHLFSDGTWSTIGSRQPYMSCKLR